MFRNFVLILLSLFVLSMVALFQAGTPDTPPAQVPAPAQANTTPAAAEQSPPAQTATTSKDFVLQDGTPVRMRTGRNVSSADAHIGDTVDFEVLEDISVGGLVVVPKGGIAFATVTEAQSKRRMARRGKLSVNIDSVRLVTKEKVALRAVKEVKGGGHTGAMTGGMVATGIVFFPAAPFFLFMHGKDITIPKGAEITAYVNGDAKLDRTKFLPTSGDPAKAATPPTSASTDVSGAQLEVSSNPQGADIEIDGKFVGSTPSDLGVTPGQHQVSVKKSGFKPWQRDITVSSGHVKIDAALEQQAN